MDLWKCNNDVGILNRKLLKVVVSFRKKKGRFHTLDHVLSNQPENSRNSSWHLARAILPARSIESCLFKHMWSAPLCAPSTSLFLLWIKISSFHVLQLHWDSNTAAALWAPEVLFPNAKLEGDSDFIDLAVSPRRSTPGYCEFGSN